jgi:TAG lipase/steryl ester hydrolase/phospholipase A2/LPA acyltransferase
MKWIGSQPRSLRDVERDIATATDYASWLEAASRHDQLTGRDKWRALDDTTLYDFSDVRDRHAYLRNLLEERDHDELLYALNEGIHGNMSGMGRPILYSQAMTGTKQLVDDYVSTIAESLQFIARVDDSKLSLAAKVDFFRRASHCYGRSALMLSGGAGLIFFHHGVVQTLVDHDLLPNVISGASAGSWISAQIAKYTDAELKAGHFDRYRYDMPFHLNPLRVLAGLQPGVTPLSVKNRAIDGIDNDMTFQEAYEHTGRYINISIAPAEKHQNSRLMNAITSPNVYIRSAVDASSSIPGVVPPVKLYAKGSDGRPKAYLPSRRWVDGSFAEDLPAKRLARLFGVNHFMVSMINPLAVPFVEDPKLRYKKGVRDMFNGVVVNTAKDALASAENYLSRFGASFASPAVLLAHGVLDQSYTGDVNMILEKKDFLWRNVLFSFPRDSEIQNLILAGKRCTWPKLAMIRNSTLISQTLDTILVELDQKELGSQGLRFSRERLLRSA